MWTTTCGLPFTGILKTKFEYLYWTCRKKEERSMAYNLDQGKLEQFAIKCLSELHDEYNELVWNRKDDNFDYVSNNDKRLALEMLKHLPMEIFIMGGVHVWRLVI